MVPRPTATTGADLRAMRRQIESIDVAPAASAARSTTAGIDHQTYVPVSPTTSEVSTPDAKVANATTASGRLARRVATTARTAAAIVHDTGADQTRSAPVIPSRAIVPGPKPSAADETATGPRPTATDRATVRRVEPRSRAATAPPATIIVTGTDVSADAPTAASPNATTVDAFSTGMSQRRDCSSVATRAATPPTSVQIGQGSPSVAAAAIPTGAVSAAASVAIARDVDGRRRRPASAAK